MEDRTPSSWGGGPAAGRGGAEAPRRATKRLAIAVWLAAVALNAVGVVFMVRLDDAGVDGLTTFGLGDVLTWILNVGVLTLGVVVVLRGSSRRYGWILVTKSAAESIVLAAAGVGLYGWYVGSWDTPGIQVAVWLQDIVAMVGLVVLSLWMPSLFPDGRPVGRWRRPFRVMNALWAAWLVGFVFLDRSAENWFYELPDSPTNPTGVLPGSLQTPLEPAFMLLWLASVVISVGSLWTRWRTSVGEQRQQLKWVLFALGVAVAVMLLVAIETLLHHMGILGQEWLFEGVAGNLAWAGVMVAIGVALLRYRLYDVDLVINRTVVYGAMSLVVIAVYALVVTGIAAVLPDVTDAGASLVAAGVVALAFAPIRSEVQRWVDRWIFGRRSDPVGVIADVGSTLATSGAPDTALQAIADTVVTALKVPGSAIVLGANGDRPAVTSGELSRATEQWPLRYQGETVGRLDVARRSPSEELTAADRQLLDNVAHYAAGVAHTVELNRELQRSRERLVVAREEERRRLRRDLHDGLGPSLASQMFRLDAALAQLETDPAVAEEQLRALKAQNRELVADIRRLVYELRPPALDELGLVGAVSSYSNQYADAGLAVTTGATPDPLGELPAAVEVAGYRIVTEAITNTIRHADATRCDVTIDRTRDILTIQIADNGTGLPDTMKPGVGLGSMHERAAELGGSLTVAAGPTGGTQVVATLPTLTTDNASVGPEVPADD